MNNNTSNANRNHRNGLSPDQRKNRVRTVSLIVLAILALAAIVTGVFLFNKNRKAKNTLETPVSLNTQEVAVVTDSVETEVIATEVFETAVVETTVPTPISTVEVQVPSPSILATKVGYYDPNVGYLHYDRSGSDYPRISPSGSDENPEFIAIDEPTAINDGLAVYTYGEVGVMFTVFPLDFDDLEENDNQLYAYGDTEVDISTDDQGKKNIILSEGAIFLKMITRDDVAEVEFPNHGDSIAKVIGGSVLLTLENKTISFWCVSEECQLEFSDKTLNFREKHMQLYYWQTNYVSDAENYWLTPQRLKEYMLWNHKCDLCMPVPPLPTLPTGTPDPYNPPTKYSLTVNTVGQGSVTPNGGTYEAGTPVTLTASPASGWQFDGWSGDASGPNNPITITMNGNKTVTATFSKIPPTKYSLTVKTVGQGSVTPNGGTYEAGTPVTLTASPASGWQFDGWSGDASGSNNPITIIMNGNKTVTATFSKIPPTMYTLTVNIDGEGEVTLDPPGGTYEEGTPVTLTASPASGWQFDGWSGDASGSNNPITITMDGNKTITATFGEIPIMYTLTTDTDGFGSIELDPPGGVYPEGTPVTLTASPASGWQFDGWVGDVSGSDNPITIIMDRNKTVIALFTWIPQNYTLTVSVQGTGMGEVTLDPPGGVYPEGTSVTLTAIPEPGHSVFVEWQGDASGSENPITITMDGNKSVIAIIMELVKKDCLKEITEGPGYVFIEQDKTLYLQ